MPFRKRASPLLGGDPVDDERVDVAEVVDDDVTALAEEAEAEAAEAEAMAAAARARARAIRLRRAASAPAPVEAEAEDPEPTPVATAEPDATTDADTTDADTTDTDTTEADTTDADTTDTEPVDEAPADEQLQRRARPPVWKVVAATLAVLCTLALLTVSGLMIWQHTETEKHNRTAAEFEAAGRQGAVTLMSLNFNSAKDDIQRIIDNTTGQFKKDFEQQAEDFNQVAQESKVVTEVTVKGAAVESIADDANSGVVLVAAETKVTNAAGAKQEPRAWRLSVNLAREGDQLKMSKVEFVP
ncbi:hypothetical protein [Mycolicibacterium baixiangningiae]|uniref:hypothetical protein n=1 Tax=Mycolicibacterium baixiangningiae TaxID=2761578 RepID=UPI0018D16553|nr:hypothetical protein [Mycolicibacterium baixiangningiae]